MPALPTLATLGKHTLMHLQTSGRSLWMVLAGVWSAGMAWGADSAAPPPPAPIWPLVFADDFEGSLAPWESPDPSAFRITAADGGRVLDQFRQSRVLTPVRSPFNRAVVRNVVVGSFQMDVRLKSTARDYPHRSLCLFFGYQDPAHLYYVHLGQQTDDHANQVFIVNGAPRVKISTQTTPGTPWDDQWHRARIIRDVASGRIDVYFDDLQTPAMTAVDRTFTFGRVGVGSFDDTGWFDDFTLHGELVSTPPGAIVP